MKGLLRSPFVQALLARLITAYVGLVTATMRWRYVNREAAEAALASEAGGAAMFWHGRIGFALAGRSVFGKKPKRVMISLSRDGEFIAKAAERLGVPTIRGSTGKAGRMLDKGGSAAFREALAFIESGGAVIIAADGPRGPFQTMPIGPVKLAKASNSQVWLGGLAGRPSIGFKSWDRARLPLPFSRGCMVLEGPLWVDPEADAAAMEATRQHWQALLRAAQARAEAMIEDEA